MDKVVNSFTREIVYDGESVIVDRIKPVNLSRISGDSYDDLLRINFTTPIEVQKAPFNLKHLLYMTRQRLIFFVNEYGKGEVPNYTCADMIIDSKLKKHRLVHTSKRIGKREFFGYTGYTSYKIIDIDENGQKVPEIGKLIGAGAKSSFGMGFYSLEKWTGKDRLV